MMKPNARMPAYDHCRQRFRQALFAVYVYRVGAANLVDRLVAPAPARGAHGCRADLGCSECSLRLTGAEQVGKADSHSARPADCGLHAHHG